MHTQKKASKCTQNITICRKGQETSSTVEQTFYSIGSEFLIKFRLPYPDPFDISFKVKKNKGAEKKRKIHSFTMIKKNNNNNNSKSHKMYSACLVKHLLKLQLQWMTYRHWWAVHHLKTAHRKYNKWQTCAVHRCESQMHGPFQHCILLARTSKLTFKRVFLSSFETVTQCDDVTSKMLLWQTPLNGHKHRQNFNSFDFKNSPADQLVQQKLQSWETTNTHSSHWK